MKSLYLIPVLILFVSCGAFKKTKTTASSSDKYLSWHYDDKKQVKQDCTRTITRDRIEYNFTFDPSIKFDPIDFKYNKPLTVPAYQSPKLEGLESTFDLLDYQLAMLLGRATTLSVKIDREQEVQKNVKEENYSKLDSGTQREIKNTATHLDVDRDTSLGANIPSWVWLILILVIVAVLGIWAKKSKLIP